MDLHSQAIEFNPIYILSIYILSVLCLYTPYSYSTINCRCISPSYLGPQIHPPRWTKTDSKGGHSVMSLLLPSLLLLARPILLFL